MTTFKQYLLVEQFSNRTKRITESQAIDFVGNQSPKYTMHLRDTKNGIYRGVGRIGGIGELYMYGDPLKGSPRRSRNTTNEYTLLFDNLPEWKKYPKRSRSFICTTSDISAEAHGNAYAVFPVDGTPVGVAPTHDMWDSFRKLRNETNIYSMQAFNMTLRHLLKSVGLKPHDESWEELLDRLRLAQQTIEELGVEEVVERSRKVGVGNPTKLESLLQYVEKTNKGLIRALADILDPQVNDFELTTPEQLNVTDEREVWFSSPAVFVDAHSLDKFLREAAPKN